MYIYFIVFYLFNKTHIFINIMKQNMKRKMVDELLDNITEWLVNQNKLLVVAIDEEKYEECAIYRDSIVNFIQVNAEILYMSKAFEDYVTIDVLITKLNNENDYIFSQLKTNYQS